MIIFYFYLPLAAAEKWNTYLHTYYLPTSTALLHKYLHIRRECCCYGAAAAAAAAADGDDDGDRTEKSGFV